MQPRPEAFEQAIAALNAAAAEAIESLLRDHATFGAKPAPVELLDVRSSGDMGCCAGRYEFALPSKDGAPTRESGKFVTVFLRQAHGAWKVVVDSLIRD